MDAWSYIHQSGLVWPSESMFVSVNTGSKRWHRIEHQKGAMQHGMYTEGRKDKDGVIKVHNLIGPLKIVLYTTINRTWKSYQFFQACCRIDGFDKGKISRLGRFDKGKISGLE